MKLDCVQLLVTQAFYSLGHEVGRKPGRFIVLPIILTGILAFGVFWVDYVNDPEYLFSPSNGPSKQARKFIEDTFTMNYSTNFDVGRMTRMESLVRLMIEAKRNKSIFDREVFDDLKLLDRAIRNVSVEWNGQTWTYKKLCAKRNKKCFGNKILDYENVLEKMANGQYTLEYPLILNLTTMDIFFSAALLGGTEVNDQWMIVSARAVMFLYFIDKDKFPQDLGRKWEVTVMESIERNRHMFSHLTVTYITSQTLEQELEKVTLSVLPFGIVTFTMMLIFSVAAALMMDWVKSKPWLGVAGCCSSAFSVIASFGFGIICGIEFIGLNVAAPFLMLGIGMDNTYLLLAAWRRTDPKLGIEERTAEAYSDAGVSITITSLTNFLSFCIGIMTPFPCVRIFCMYTALSVLFMYIFQITFFGGCMALTGYAEQKNLHGLFFFKVVPKSLSSHRGLCYRLFCTGGINPEDSENKMDNGENMLMTIFRDKLGKALTLKSVQFIVIILFIVYLGFGLWGCTVIKEGLERVNMARYDSYAIDQYEIEDKYFKKYPHRIQVVINKTLDYSDPKVQQEVENVLQSFDKSRFMAGPRFTESWLHVYKQFFNDTRAQSFLNGYNMSRKADFYEGIRKVFFRLLRNYFKQDIIFNDDFSEITASRFILQSVNILDVNEEKDMLIELRAIAENCSLPVTVFSTMFVYYDQFAIVRQTAMQSIFVATLIMVFVSFMLIPVPVCAMWVALSIFSIEIGVIGYMSWWNVNLDVVSMITVILCIGFSVDYSAHITYTYVASEEKNPEEKLKQALHSVGLPIVQGSLSTVIGIAMMNFVPSYICHVFFKTVFLVVVFGALHGLFLLPIALRLTDTFWQNFIKWKNGDKSLPQSYFETTIIDGIVLETKNGKGSWNRNENGVKTRDNEMKNKVKTNDDVSKDLTFSSVHKQNGLVNEGFEDDNAKKDSNGVTETMCNK